MTYLAKQGTIQDNEILGLGSKLSMRPVAGSETTTFEVEFFRGTSFDGSYFFDVAGLQCLITQAGIVGAVGGRTVGTVLAADAIYYAYLMGDTTGTNPDVLMIDDHYQTPALPAGYDQYRFIGGQYTDAGQNLYSLRKSDDFVLFYDRIQIATSGGGGGTALTQYFVGGSGTTNYTTWYTKKILLSVDVDTLNNRESFPTYDAYTVFWSGGGVGGGQFTVQTGCEVSGTGTGRNIANAQGWVDVINVGVAPSARSFYDHLDTADRGIYIIGHQEPI